MNAYSNFGPRSRPTNPSTEFPQTQPIPGTNQTRNNAGAYSWQVDDLTQLRRFLILGSAGGTFYIGERELTRQNLDVVERLLVAGQGRTVVDVIVAISEAGRAVSNDPALFALARCAGANDVAVRQYALSMLPRVARTGTHLLHFISYVEQFRGWGRALKRAVATWYNDRREKDLSFQLLKYQSRDKWSQRDGLRLSHPKPATETHSSIYHWATQGWPGIGEEPHPDEAQRILWAFERAKRCEDEREIADLIKTYRLPREAVPTQFLHSERIWEALLQDMPMEAMTRNLATMTREGVIAPMSDMTQQIAKRLRNKDALLHARMHPLKLLVALKTYASGKSVRGTGTWLPVREIIEALSDAFYLAFAAAPPTGKRILIAIDTSGSMSYGCINKVPNLSVHEAAGAMALVTANTESQYHIIGVDTAIQFPTISPRQRLDDVVHALDRYRGGGTNLALPMLYALEKRIEVDAFVIYTDAESWAGDHPAIALERYRQQMGIATRLVNVQMVSTRTTNNDPTDALAMECIGFDTSTPQVISSFICGEF